MSLKELTADKHALAENTPFMKAVFQQSLNTDDWIDFVVQKQLLYTGIESVASAAGLLTDMPDIQRSHYLFLDSTSMLNGRDIPAFKKITIDYYNYILSLYPDSDRIMAHLYVWHMGDLFGGQMIKKMISGSHKSLDFDNPDYLKTKIRTKLKDSMAAEANVAFDWAISILNTYHVE